MANNATGTGHTPIIVFPAHAQRTTEVIYAPASSITDQTADVYDFVPVNGDNLATNYLNSGGALTYSPPPAPTLVPQPQPLAFQLAAAQDATIPTEAILCLAGFAGVISQTTLQTLPVLQALWAKVVAAYAQPASGTTPAGPLFGNCTDGVSIVTKFETYAVDFNCPLVAS